MQGLDIKTVSLDVIGFCMKAEAGKVAGDIIPVTRELWLEIANRLQKEKSVNVEKILERLYKLEPQSLGVEYTDGVCDAIEIIKEELSYARKDIHRKH